MPAGAVREIGGATAGGEDGGASDFDDAARSAFANPFGDDEVAPAGDEDGPPLAELEARMHGELAEREAGASASPSARRAAAKGGDEDEAGDKAAKLPELDELVARIPAGAREVLDELFRARFVSVKKLPRRLFQIPATKGAQPGAEQATG